MAINAESKKWLNYHFKWKSNDDDGTIDVFEQKKYIMENIPNDIQQFNISHDDFYFDGLNITTLRGSPKICNYSFYCAQTNIKSLEYSPETVYGIFNCNCTAINSLKYAPEYVGNNFYCDGTNITSLKYCPSYVGENFICRNTKIIDPYEYRYALTCHIGGYFDCGIQSINDIINEYLNCSSEIRPKAFLELNRLRDTKWR